MNITVTIIPTDLVTKFATSLKIARIRFSASWWSGNEKYFCYLFIANRALLQSHTEFNRLL